MTSRWPPRGAEYELAACRPTTCSRVPASIPCHQLEVVAPSRLGSTSDGAASYSGLTDVTLSLACCDPRARPGFRSSAVGSAKSLAHGSAQPPRALSPAATVPVGRPRDRSEAWLTSGRIVRAQTRVSCHGSAPIVAVTRQSLSCSKSLTQFPRQTRVESSRNKACWPADYPRG